MLLLCWQASSIIHTKQLGQAYETDAAKDATGLAACLVFGVALVTPFACACLRSYAQAVKTSPISVLCQSSQKSKTPHETLSGTTKRSNRTFNPFLPPTHQSQTASTALSCSIDTERHLAPSFSHTRDFRSRFEK